MWQPPVNDGVTTQSRYVDFSREDWARLRSNTPLTLSDADLLALRGLNDVLDMREVVDIYLPLSRLLSLYVQATRGLHQVTSRFLGAATIRVPFVIGLAGSVAIGAAAPFVASPVLARYRCTAILSNGPPGGRPVDQTVSCTLDPAASGRSA